MKKIRMRSNFYTLLIKVKGSITRFLIKERDRSIANPNNLKGSKISQKKGYKINANKANGQHSTIKINQRRKLIINYFLEINTIVVPDEKIFL